MAVASGTSQTLTRDRIVTKVLLKLGAIGQGEDPEAEEINDIEEAINTMIQSWSVAGVDMMPWTSSRQTLTLTDATASYTIGPGGDKDIPRPVDVLHAELRNTSTKSLDPLLIMSEEEFDRIGNKTLAGTTDRVFFKPGFPLWTVYVYPVIATAANWEIHFVVQRGLFEFQNNDDTPDMPKYLEQAIIYGAAAEVADDYPTLPADRLQRIEAKAGSLLAALIDKGNREHAKV